MKTVYNIDLSTAGIDELIHGLSDSKTWLRRKTDELCRRLSDIGAEKAEINFSSVIYDGPEDHAIDVVSNGPNSYAVRASGSTVLFVEFGSGLIGYGHPEPNGYGPGTYPGQGHWADPNGWYYAHGQHSYGNPPNMPMYKTVTELEQSLEQVVREVFST